MKSSLNPEGQIKYVLVEEAWMNKIGHAVKPPKYFIIEHFCSESTVRTKMLFLEYLRILLIFRQTENSDDILNSLFSNSVQNFSSSKIFSKGQNHQFFYCPKI